MSAKVPASDTKTSILQVDASAFPQVTFYMTALDSKGAVVKGLVKDDFALEEGATGDKTTTPVAVSVSQGATPVSIDLVLDTSASMADSGKLDLARGAISGLLSAMDLAEGDAAGLVSFADQPYLAYGFSCDAAAVNSAAAAVTAGGYSATCDAIEAAVWQASTNATGARCVIVITDGIDDASKVTYAEAGEFARSCGIPVTIVGIGSGYDVAPLKDLATSCGGSYVDASAMDATALSQALAGVYSTAKSSYALTFTCAGASGSEVGRTLQVSSSADAEHTFQTTCDYQSRTQVASDFSAAYRDAAFILPDSDSREIDYSEYYDMSLAELRIAYNEIFARHGRAFDDPMLTEWFDTRTWYLQSQTRYSAPIFDANNPSPLSKIEYDNAMAIEDYIQELVALQAVLSNTDTVALTGYDLCLPTDLLQTALAQTQALAASPIQKANVALLQAEAASPTPRFSRSAATAAPTAVEPVDPRLVVCDSYEFMIPEYWVGRVTVEVNGDEVDIYCNDYMDDPMVGMNVGSRQMNGGDIGDGIVDQVPIGQDRYVIIGIHNIPYFIWDELRSNFSPFADVSDSVESELVDLCTGGNATLEEVRTNDAYGGMGGSCYSMPEYVRSTITPTVTAL